MTQMHRFGGAKTLHFHLCVAQQEVCNIKLASMVLEKGWLGTILARDPFTDVHCWWVSTRCRNHFHSEIPNALHKLVPDSRQKAYTGAVFKGPFRRVCIEFVSLRHFESALRREIYQSRRRPVRSGAKRKQHLHFFFVHFNEKEIR